MRPNLDTLSLQQKLEGYINESSAKLVKNVTKSNTLKYVLPFAAAAVMPTVMSGQCGLGTFNATGGYYSDGQIDVNGDGNPDFDFDIAGNNLWMTVVGTMDQGQTNAAASQAINGAFPAGWDINIYNIELIGDVTTTATFYVPIRDGAGNLGFIEITTGGGTFTINLANSGVGDVTTSVNAGDCASILPVELSSFDVKAANRNLALSWTTASEVNNFGFEVQRSMDGIGFQKIGWVKGEGNSNKEMSYSFVDSKVKANVEYYYRLKQIDFDGRTEMSDIRSAKMIDESAMTIGEFYPNPVSNKTSASIEVISGTTEEMTLTVYDNVGRVALASTHTLTVGTNTVMVGTENLSSGNYYVKIEAAGNTEYKKLLIVE